MSDKVNQLPKLDIGIIQVMTNEAKELNKAATDLQEQFGIHQEESKPIDPGLAHETNSKKMLGRPAADKRFVKSKLNPQSQNQQKPNRNQQSKVSIDSQRQSKDDLITSNQSKSTLEEQQLDPKPKTISDPTPRTKKSNQDGIRPSQAENTSKNKQTTDENTPKNKQTTDENTNPSKSTSKSDSLSENKKGQDELESQFQNEIKALNQRLREWQVAVHARLERIGNDATSNLEQLSSKENKEPSLSTGNSSSIDEVVDFENALIRFGAEVNELLGKLGSIPGVNSESINFVQKISIVVVRNKDPEKGDPKSSIRSTKAKRTEKRKKNKRPPKRKDGKSGLGLLFRRKEKKDRSSETRIK